MGKNSVTKGKEKSSRTKLDTAIIVALIGLCGTLVTALLASPVLINWMNKQSTPAPIETATFFQPLGLSTETPLGQDWTSILRFSPTNDHCGARVLPATINPNENVSIAGQQLAQAVQNNEDLNWLRVMSPFGPDNFHVDVFSIVTDREWIKLSNELVVGVTVQKDLPEHLNVASYSECGGGGQLREFPVFDVSNTFDEYKTTSEYSEVDFFTLQPGEFEAFLVSFQCKGVGIYRFNIQLSYEYKGIAGVTDFEFPVQFACPQTFTQWHYDIDSYQLLAYTNFSWNGNGYDIVP